MDNGKRIPEDAAEKGIIGIAVYLCLRLKRLLQAVCDDGFVALNDGVEYLYAHLRHKFLKVFEEPCLKPLREAIPLGAMPESLCTVDPDDWDFVLSKLNAFNAKVMKFCVERGVDPLEEVPVLEEVFGYGKAIDVYKAEKDKQVQAFWARFGKGAEKGPEQQADKEEPAARGREPVGAPRLEERDDAEEKKKAAREYLALRAKGMKAEVAAQRLGYSSKTLERWVKRLLDNNGQ